MLLLLSTALKQNCLHISLDQPGPIMLAKFAWICDHLLLAWGQAAKLQILSSQCCILTVQLRTLSTDGIGMCWVPLVCVSWGSSCLDSLSFTEDSYSIWGGDTIRINYWLAGQKVLLARGVLLLELPLMPPFPEYWQGVCLLQNLSFHFQLV